MLKTRTLASLVTLGGLAAGAVAAPASPAAARPGDAVQRSVNDLVAVDGFPGATASVRQPDGRVRNWRT
jgi:D-alanyl-D-alanine carboxypeptidase